MVGTGDRTPVWSMVCSDLLGGLDLLGWNAPDGVVMLGGRAALAVGLTIPA